MREQKLKISFNSPVILGFAVICFGAVKRCDYRRQDEQHVF